MKLRERFAVTLVLITLLLIAPAVYGLFALRELRETAENLSMRDAVGALALGRLQSAYSNLDNAQRIYHAIGGGEGDDARAARARVEAAIGDAEAALETLNQGGYDQVTAPALSAWDTLMAAIAEQHRLIEDGQIEASDSFGLTVVDAAFEQMDETLDPIGLAINQAGAEQVERARAIAARAATTVLVALAIALAAALLIASWLARSVLRPVGELRRGMALVAEGDFEPDMRIDTKRPDEIGDLARSFRRMAKDLEALDRLKAEFVSVASHELKTPLSVIRGYVSLLRDGIYGDVPDDQRKALISVSDQTDRLGRLIQQLLDVSRFEAGGVRLDLQEVALRPFLEDLVTSFDALAQQNQIRFQLEMGDDLPQSIIADPDRLNEVVGNLLSNSFKFTPRDGSITLRAQTVNGDLVIEVSDTGVGIPPDKVDRIFEKFFQVENDAQPLSEGSGLGLAIAREIVESHEGTISAESELGQGTTFRIVIPEREPLASSA